MDINAVITGDLVKSQRIKNTDIALVIGSLKETFNAINQTLLQGKGTFEIFRGDSFQGLIPQPELALLVSILIRAHLRTYEPSIGYSIAGHKFPKEKPILGAYSDARISIGIGTVSYNAHKVVESRGEAFEKSGRSFDTMTKTNERLVITTPWENMNSELTVEFMLADAIISRWTATTAAAIYNHLLYNKSQKELAEQFSISQPGVHKRLMIYGNLNSIQVLLERYQELITKAL